MHLGIIGFSVLALASGGVMAGPAVAHGQSSVEVTPILSTGDTVRVWAGNPRLEGAIAAFSRIQSTDLVITGQGPNPYGPGREFTVPFGSVSRIEVLRRHRPSAGKMLAGIVIGGGIGALIGAPMGPIIECGGACDREGDLQPMVGKGLGAAIGAGIGAILGGVVVGHTRTRWESVTFSVR
jgi:hypothetical protein